MGLSQRAIAFSALVGLAVTTQTAFRLSQRNGKYEYNTFSAMTIVEFMKLLMSFFHHYKANKYNIDRTRESLKNVPSHIVTDYAVLAASYAVYNQLIFASLKTVDPGTFSLFKSFTPVIVSMMNRFFFGLPLSVMQWGCILVQISGMLPIIMHQNENGEQKELSSDLRDIVLIVFTITMGSLNTVYNANKVKAGKIPVQVQNVVLYLFGFLFNLGFYFFVRDREKHFFYGYENPGVILIIILNSFVGIAVTMIYKYGDAVLKTMVQPVASSMLIFISYIFFGMSLDLIKMLGAAVVIMITIVFLRLPSLQSEKRKMSSSIRLIRMLILLFVVVAGKIITKSTFKQESLLDMSKDVKQLPIVLIVQALKVREVNQNLPPDSRTRIQNEMENLEKLAIFEAYRPYFKHVILDSPYYFGASNDIACTSSTEVAFSPLSKGMSCFECSIPFNYNGDYDRSRYACASEVMKIFDPAKKSSAVGFMVIHADFFLLPTFISLAQELVQRYPRSFWLPYSLDNIGNVDSFAGEPYKLSVVELTDQASDTAFSSLSRQFDTARRFVARMIPGESRVLSPVWKKQNGSSIIWVDLYFVPKRLWDKFFYLSPFFQKLNVMNEMALNGILSYSNQLVDETTLPKGKVTPHVEIICAGGNRDTSIGIIQFNNSSFLKSNRSSCGHKIDLGNSDVRRALIKAWSEI